MTEQGGEHERPSAGMKLLKWLAPLSSGAVLAYLVMRVSSCADDPTRDTVHAIVAEPAPPQQQAQASAPVPDAGALTDPALLGGSKSGIIGILQAQQRAAEAMNDPSSLHFLGTTKAPPQVISEAAQAPQKPAAPASKRNRQRKVLGGTKSGIDLHPEVEGAAP